MRRQQVIASLQQHLQLAQEHLTFSTIGFHRLLGVTLGVFVAIQMHLERLIVLFNQRGDVRLSGRITLEQPILRIVLRQGPVHDRQAFIDDLTVDTQHGDRALGRQRKHFGRFGFQADLDNLHRYARIAQGHARSHGVRAAAERVQRIHLTSRVLKPLPWRWT